MGRPPVQHQVTGVRPREARVSAEGCMPLRQEQTPADAIIRRIRPPCMRLMPLEQPSRQHLPLGWIQSSTDESLPSFRLCLDRAAGNRVHPAGSGGLCLSVVGTRNERTGTGRRRHLRGATVSGDGDANVGRVRCAATGPLQSALRDGRTARPLKHDPSPPSIRRSSWLSFFRRRILSSSQATSMRSSPSCYAPLHRPRSGAAVGCAFESPERAHCA